MLTLVGLKKWATHRPYELSGGQQQRVAIARAIVTRPALILADEPTGELDSATGQQIMELFREIVDREQTTLLIATHNLAVDAFADRVCLVGRRADSRATAPRGQFVSMMHFEAEVDLSVDRERILDDGRRRQLSAGLIARGLDVE